MASLTMSDDFTVKGAETAAMLEQELCKVDSKHLISPGQEEASNTLLKHLAIF